MTMTIQKVSQETLIDLMNKDLALEYGAAIQYLHYATTIKGATYMPFQEEMYKHSKEEMDHAKMIAVEIDYLGGKLQMKVEGLDYTDNPEQMVKNILNRERDAIHRYKERIGQAEQLGLFGVRAVFEQILSVEQEHERDALMVMGI